MKGGGLWVSARSTLEALIGQPTAPEGCSRKNLAGNRSPVVSSGELGEEISTKFSVVAVHLNAVSGEADGSEMLTGHAGMIIESK